MTLTGQKVVVIGGSSGMGLATARAAAQAGAAVTIASSSKERLDAALAGLPGGSAGIVADTRDEDSLAALFEQVGQLDHLVYTAGEQVAPAPLVDVPLAAARQRLDVRFWGAVAAVKHAVPRMSPRGSISVTSGTVGVRPVPGFALGAAGVGAIEGLARGLAVELAPIRVNALSPGIVDSGAWDGLGAGKDKFFAGVAASNPARRVGRPEDLSSAALLALTNPYLTGTTLHVDGGGRLA